MKKAKPRKPRAIKTKDVVAQEVGQGYLLRVDTTTPATARRIARFLAEWADWAESREKTK